MIDPLFTLFLCLGFALLLLFSAWHKTTRWPKFLAILADYQVMPQRLLIPAAICIAFLEALLSLAWFLSAFVQPPALLLSLATAGLLCGYAAAIGLNLLRGRSRIDCGCSAGFAAPAGAGLSWWQVGRNILLAILALITLAPTASRSLGLADSFNLVAALAATVLLILAHSQLAANRAAIKQWKARHD